jgi:hypothetical protein
LRLIFLAGSLLTAKKKTSFKLVKTKVFAVCLRLPTTSPVGNQKANP